MRLIEIEELKRLQLDILVSVADFCEKNNIRYFLSGGSMLGAVRHKGFIPWDDDIDVNMPRPDYNRFIKEYKNDKYSVCCWEKDHHYLCTYAKVEDKRTVIIDNGDFGRKIGVNIDIFPVDGLPKKANAINLTVKKMKTLWGLVVCATVKDISKRTWKKKLEITIMRCFYSIFPIKSFITGLCIKQAQKYSFERSPKVAVLVWGYGKREIIMHSTASKYQKVDFEEHKFNIPRNYDDYLSHIYGDYMKLPPKDEQVYKHDLKAYWK